MSLVRIFWILVVLILPRTSARGDAVLCTFMESCILPCTFDPGDHVLIHWIKEKDIGVHSFYRDKDQFERQNQQFSGRTTLFRDQLQYGNASLGLAMVKLLDQGRYKCYTSTTIGNKELLMDLNVEAPPREVNIKQESDTITCSSEKIFPQPTLTWSSNPPVTLRPDTQTLDKTQQELYSIKSSLEVLESNVSYTCTINTGRNTKSATLYKMTSVDASDTETTLPCMSSNFPSKSLVWTFNHSHNILTWPSSNDRFTASEEWRRYVKSVSESGDLTLRYLTTNQAGTYTCELSTAEQKHIRSTELTVTESQGSSKTAGIAVGVVVTIILLIVVALVALWKFRKRVSACFNKEKISTEPVTREMEHLASNGGTGNINKKENEKNEEDC